MSIVSIFKLNFFEKEKHNVILNGTKNSEESKIFILEILRFAQNDN